jgi:hypothetical protein
VIGWRYALSLPPRQMTISLIRMSMSISFGLQKHLFSQGLHLYPPRSSRGATSDKPLGPSSLCTETLGVISSCAQPFSCHSSFQFHIGFAQNACKTSNLRPAQALGVTKYPVPSESDYRPRNSTPQKFDEIHFWTAAIGLPSSAGPHTNLISPL